MYDYETTDVKQSADMHRFSFAAAAQVEAASDGVRRADSAAARGDSSAEAAHERQSARDEPSGCAHVERGARVWPGAQSRSRAGTRVERGPCAQVDALCAHPVRVAVQSAFGGGGGCCGRAPVAPRGAPDARRVGSRSNIPAIGAAAVGAGAPPVRQQRSLLSPVRPSRSLTHITQNPIMQYFIRPYLGIHYVLIKL